MNIPKEYPLKGLVGEEIHVLEPQLQARRHTDAIFNYEASSEQIEQWWYAQDPLNITDILRVEAVALTGDPEKINALHNDIFQDCLTSGRAGATLTADVLKIDTKEVLQESHPLTNKKSYIGKLLSKKEVQPSKKSKQIAILDECIKQLASAPDEIIEKNAHKLFLAAEMLRLSTGEVSEMVEVSNILTYKDDKEKQKITSQLASSKTLNLAFHQSSFEDIQETCAKQYQLSEEMLFKIGDVLVFQRLGDEYNFVDDKHMLGIKALTYLSSDKIGLPINVPNNAKGHLNKDYFKLMMVAIDSVFSKKRLGNKTISSKVKGSLYETMWFLDAFVARMIEPDKYGDIEVIPAYSKDDASKLNHPDLRRNIDMLVTYHHLTDYAQLKSSPYNPNKPGHKKTKSKVGSMATKFAFSGEYHPGVTMIDENNFKEAQPKRLRNKIYAYKQWIDSGFDDSLKPNLEENIMPTVIAEFDKIISSYNSGYVSLPQQTKNILMKETLGRQQENKQAASGIGNGPNSRTSDKAKRKAQKASRKQNRRSK